MWLVFERFMSVVDHWMRTGEWKREEFRVRGSRTATWLAWALVGSFAGLCVLAAIHAT
jgi:hypothetical protein